MVWLPRKIELIGVWDKMATEGMTSMKASTSKLCEIGTTCGWERGCQWLLPVPARKLPARLPWPLVAKALPVRPLILTLTTLQLGGGFHEAHVLRFQKISLRLLVCLYVCLFVCLFVYSRTTLFAPDTILRAKITTTLKSENFTNSFLKNNWK